jgi:hypothetical protein
MLRWLSLGASILVCLAASRSVLAQAGPSTSPAPANPGEGSAPGGTAPSSPSAPAGTTGTTVVVQPTPSTGYGFPDGNAGLPSGSQPFMGGSGQDGFDLNQPSGGGSAVVYGGKGSAAVIDTPARPVQVPVIHVVRKGDTLWDLCDTYYQNPWGWPKVWSYNPQVVNPHWIYPGDQLRLRDPNGGSGVVAAQQTGARGGPAGRRGSGQAVAPSSVFLREQGFLGDPKRDVWGELVGAVEDQMLLSDGNHVYLMMRPGVTLSPGQTLTVFNSVRTPEDVPNARTPPGEIVAVKGTVKIDQFNTKTRVARGKLVESLDVIERGYKVGPVGRQFDVVAARAATKNVEAHVLTSFYPHELLGQNQLIFLDRGSDDGLAIGTRMFVLRKGDTWRNSIKVASGMLKDRVRIDSSERVEVETTPTRGDDKEFPSEVVAELRVLRAEKFSSLAIVIEARREIEAGDVALAIAGK